MADKLRKGPSAVDFSFTVPAGRTRRLDLGGTFFRIVSANLAFSITIDSFAPFQVRPGDVYHCPSDEFFTSLTVTNDTASTLAVTITIGQGDISSPNAAQLPWPTRVVASALNSIAGGATETFTGVPTNPNVLRQELLVSNIDPGLNIQILDEANNIALTIFPQTSVSVPGSALVRVHNPNGAAVAVSMSEIWAYNP